MSNRVDEFDDIDDDAPAPDETAACGCERYGEFWVVLSDCPTHLL